MTHYRIDYQIDTPDGVKGITAFVASVEGRPDTEGLIEFLKELGDTTFISFTARKEKAPCLK